MCRVVGGSSKVARAEIHALSLEGDSDCALSFGLEPRSGCCIFLNTGTEGVFGDSECYLPILRAIPERGGSPVRLLYALLAQHYGIQ